MRALNGFGGLGRTIVLEIGIGLRAGSCCIVLKAVGGWGIGGLGLNVRV